MRASRGAFPTEHQQAFSFGGFSHRPPHEASPRQAPSAPAPPAPGPGEPMACVQGKHLSRNPGPASLWETQKKVA